MNESTSIRWQEWTPKAFAQSKSSGKPILLDLTAVWCHWCHRMDQDNYERLDIIRLVNEHFIPVRVDVDKHPEIANRYHFGGFPTTAFLDSNGNIVTGATYVPPGQFEALLHHVKSIYRPPPAKTDSKEEQLGFQAPPEELSMEGTGHALNALKSQFDHAHGGFGFAPKFPLPDAMDLLLLEYVRTKDPVLLGMAVQTLNAMRTLQDPVEKGFYRYATQADWTEPHYEKMTETHAGLILAYTHAFALTQNPAFRQTVQDTLMYVQAHLQSPDGWFYASQDADEEYYSLNELQRTQRKAPHVDPTFFTHLNGMMTCAFLEAGTYLGEKKWIESGLRALEYTLTHAWKKRQGLAHFLENNTRAKPALLADYAWALRAVLSACEYARKTEYVKHAIQLFKECTHLLYDPHKKVFYDVAPSKNALGLVARRETPLNENSLMALNALKLHAFTGEEKYATLAQHVLKATAFQAQDAGYLGALHATACKGVLNPMGVCIIGHPNQEFNDLWHTAITPWDPRKTIVALDAQAQKGIIQRKGFIATQLPAGFVCLGTRCLPPAFTSLELEKRMQERA
ncbi:MAG: thioredoxin domain-containing protein [Candidatus Diapherotrites archaeon]|nr:thioredoxin domain-containing protein [Candidatus Diapherotrites archaeon]